MGLEVILQISKSFIQAIRKQIRHTQLLVGIVL